MKDRDEIIKAARQYVSKGQINDAITEYLKILPFSVDGTIHNIIGDLYLKNASTDEAIKYFREAAVMFNKDESHAKAIALYHKILSIKPDQHAVEMELAELNAERGFITQAIEGMIRAAEVYYSKGLPMKALGVYKKALKLCPSNIQLKFIIADLHLEANRIDRAVKLYLTIAMEYKANAESDRAEYMYKKIFSLDPDNIESLIHLSRLAEDDQNLELALEYMSKAAAIAPHNSEIMSEYSNLATKANKDISESSQQVQDVPDHREPQHIKIPDTMQNFNKTDNTHEPLDLSSDSRNNDNQHSSKPISTSSPLPVTSTGSGNEETGFTVPHDTDATGIEKNGIWDNSPDEDYSSPSVIDSLQGKTSDAIPDHETAEAVYDEHTEKNNVTMSIKKTGQNKSIKDSQRLKRRVKTNRMHFLLIVIFTCLTAISFLITFKFIKNTQTVDVETQEHVISPEPYNQNSGEDRDMLNNENTITDLNTDEEKLIHKPDSLNTWEYPQEINQDELTLSDKESDTPGIDSEMLPDNSIDTALEEEGDNYPNKAEDPIVSTMTPDRESMHVTEEPQVIHKGKLTVPVREPDTPGIDSEILPDNSIDTVLEEEANNYPNNTEDTIVSTIKPDREALHVTEEPQVIHKGKLTVPVREADPPVIDSEMLPDNSIDTVLEEEGSNNPNNTEDTTVSTMKPDLEAIHITEEPHVIHKGKLTVPVREADTPGLDREILPDNSIDTVLEEEGNNNPNNTEDTTVSTMKPDREIVQENKPSHLDTKILAVPETTDQMQQQEEHEEDKTALISFNELFENNNNNWDIVETSAAYVRLKNGKYYIRNRRSSGAYVILNGPYISTDLNFEIESHLDSVDPSEDHTYGLIFGAKNKEDFFVFQILPQNKYSIKKYFRGAALELAGGNINSRPEAQDLYNVLKITCKDNKLSFFINGNFINEVPDIYFSRRKTGLFIDSNAEIVVDKILLHQQP